MRPRCLFHSRVPYLVWLSPVLLALAACGGGSQPDVAPTDDPPPLINAVPTDSDAPAPSTTDIPQPAAAVDDLQPATPEEPPPAADSPTTPDGDAPAPDDPSTPPPAPTEAASDEPPTASPRDPDDLLVTPNQFPQPSSSITVDVIPHRPDAFADYGQAALPWLQGRTSVDAILPLFDAWRMPPVIGGFRLNLVDTDGDALLPDDGRSAIVIVYTDPPSTGVATGFSNLVIYEPLPEDPGVFRIAYDHDLVEQSFDASSGRSGIAVTAVTDANGDGLRDITFQELICDAAGCRRLTYVLSNVGDAYRRLKLP